MNSRETERAELMSTSGMLDNAGLSEPYKNTLKIICHTSDLHMNDASSEISQIHNSGHMCLVKATRHYDLEMHYM